MRETIYDTLAREFRITRADAKAAMYHVALGTQLAGIMSDAFVRRAQGLMLARMTGARRGK